jgi:hypothetical protein
MMVFQPKAALLRGEVRANSAARVAELSQVDRRVSTIHP